MSVKGEESRVSRETFSVAVSDFGLAGHAIDLLWQHWKLVAAWNARTNLTAISDSEEAAWLHYRDSLEGGRVLVPGDIVDLGSGAGYPGVPLAIAWPERRVALVEPRRKRVSFLKTAVARLGLENVEVLQARMEDSESNEFDNVVTRATFSDSEQLLCCRKWARSGGRFVAYRGPVSTIGLSPDQLHTYRLRDESRSLLIWDC